MHSSLAGAWVLATVDILKNRAPGMSLTGENEFREQRALERASSTWERPTGGKIRTGCKKIILADVAKGKETGRTNHCRRADSVAEGAGARLVTEKTR